MAHVSKTGLRLALERLQEWREREASSIRRPTQTFFRYFILKYLRVKSSRPSRPISTSDFSEVCRKFLQIVYDDERLGGEWLYVPITGDYQRVTRAQLGRAGTDYAIGTMWTAIDRSEDWKNIVTFNTIGGARSGRRVYQFKPDYLDVLATKVMKDVKVPALPLALFFFRRPTDSTTPVLPRSKARLLELFRRTFNISLGEFRRLFDDGDALPPNALAEREMTREDVISVLRVVVGEPTEGASGDPVAAPATPAPPAPPIPLHVSWPARAPTATALGLVGLREVMQRAVASLRAGKHVVLMGPPGTGKTTLATAICKWLKAPYELVTATSDWTTYDTIGAYLPDPQQGAAGAEPLNFIPAVVTQSWLDGKWLIIDELNRADIDKAFGELFTLFSNHAVRLPYKHRSGRSLQPVVLGSASTATTFGVQLPSDWRLIGTMNTFDKASLYQMSFAFMRRFAFLDLPVPSARDYAIIIEREAAIIRRTSLRKAVVGLAERIFAPQAGQGLGRAGIEVGPAIAIDVLHYIAERTKDVRRASAPDLVREGIEMYLYPQFEGREKEHESIVQIIGDILALTVDDRIATSRKLAVWTGFEEARE